MLPFGEGPASNGEFLPAAPSAHDRDIFAATLAEVEQAAHRAAIDRRLFLRGAGGVAAALTVFNLAACSGGSRRSEGSTTSRSTSTSSTTSTPGGTFTVPTTADVPACQRALAGDELIFDVHTHHVMPQRPWRQTAPATVGLVRGMLPECSAPDPFECANRDAYLHSMFLTSDTTISMLTDVPATGPDDAPMPFSDAVGTQQFAAQLTGGGASRVLVHNIIAPNFGALNERLDGMEATAATGKVAAFKVYTAWGPNGRGYALDDPAIGLPVVQKARDLGVKVIVAHKGIPLLNFDSAHNGPEDMVAASRVFPDMQFVVFHSNWNPNHTEGPYNPAAPIGIDRLIAALDAHRVPPNSNVWVDLGAIWRSLLRRPDQAAHMLGKLLSRVGENRVMWGTDAVWYGSPQPQIMAFRAFQISEEFQERFRYPALTDALKRKVFGLNAALLFDVDPEATRCALATDPIAGARAEATDLHDTGIAPPAWHPNGPTTRREMLRWLAAPATRWTPF